MTDIEDLHIARAADALGERLAGELAHRIRRDFRDLRRIEGFDQARATIAEIINSEAERKSV